MTNFARTPNSMVALVTPFEEANSKVSYGALEKLVDFHIKSKTGALVVTGTTGESSTMTHAEQKEVIKKSVEMCKGTGVKVVAGTGSNSTKEAVSLTAYALEAGADAALIITPYYNRPSPKGVIEHYVELDKVGIPFYLYNLPRRTGINVDPKTTLLILEKCKNMIGLKASNGLLDEIATVALEAAKINPKFQIVSGDDALTIPILSIGGCGTISVIANFVPNLVAISIDYFMAGEITKAALIQQHLVELSNTAMGLQASPAATKAILGKMGFEVGGTRPPLCDLTPEEINLAYATFERISKIEF